MSAWLSHHHYDKTATIIGSWTQRARFNNVARSLSMRGYLVMHPHFIEGRGAADSSYLTDQYQLERYRIEISSKVYLVTGTAEFINDYVRSSLYAASCLRKEIEVVTNDLPDTFKSVPFGEWLHKRFSSGVIVMPHDIADRYFLNMRDERRTNTIRDTKPSLTLLPNPDAER